jgi:trehalose/maltose hydrolase-like predicted phosphorylase
MYPWEADPATGRDVTPGFAIENADREIHVNGAVALAQWQYYLASGDRGWLAKHAFPVMSAVADFWASRAAWAQARKRFELDDVTSPEEDYVHVDNEIYTNLVAEASLRSAGAAAKLLGRPANPRWAQVADKLYLPTAGEGGVYHDFDPSTPHDKTSSWMATSVPMLSIPALDFQAPRAALEGLFEHSVKAVGRVRSHANQMILVMLALQAADLGKSEYFEGVIGGAGKTDPFLKPPFHVRSETPQNDSTYLLASSGGFLQAFIFGLSGLRLGATGLEPRYEASLPPSIRALTLRRVHVRNQTLDIRIDRDSSGKVHRVQQQAAP